MPTLVLAIQNTNSPPRMRLDVGGAETGAVDVVINRTDPGGKVAPVRLADPAVLTTGTAVVFDYEMPYGAAVSYTATTRDSNGVALGTVTNGPVTLAPFPEQPWLIHPGIPSLSVPLASVVTFGDRVRVVNQGVFTPYGRRDPVVVTDGRRKSPSGQVRLRTRTLADRDSLLTLVDDATTLLVNVPAGLGWGVGAEYWAVGDLTEARDVEVGADQYRSLTAPYLVVGSPPGGQQPTRTYATVLSEASTYQQVLNRRATYLELLAPTN